MSKYLGDFTVGSTVYLPWHTNDAAGASITRGTDGSIRIYKDGSATERSSANGITDTEDFDGLTGVHLLSIDLSDDSDPGFYAAGHDYTVVLVGAEIDGQTVNAVLGTFSIENRKSSAAGTIEKQVEIYGPKKAAAFTTFVTLQAIGGGGIKLVPTIAVGDFKISKDGGALANLTTLPTESPAGSGLVKIVLDSTEMNADAVVIRWSDQAGNEWKDGSLVIHTRTVTVDELVRSTTPANALDVSATGEVGLDFTNVKTPATQTPLTNVSIPHVSTVDLVQMLGNGSIHGNAMLQNTFVSEHFDSSFFQQIWALNASLANAPASIGAFIQTYIASLISSMGNFNGTGVRTVKGYLEAIANSAAIKPPEFGNFDGATDSLEKIGEQAAGIGYSSGDKVIARLASLISSMATLTPAVYSARLDYVVDNAGSADEYTVVPLKNGVPFAATNVRIEVLKRSDGSTLIARTGMTQIGSSKFWKYNATGGQRAAAGESICVLIEITDGAAVNDWAEIRGRDA